MIPQLDWATVGVVLGAAVPIFGIYLAYRTYNRKSGLRIRGTFTIMSSMSCEDRYVSRVTIENRKDRSVTVFAIYLRIGHNYYIIVEDFGDSPLILKAFETYQQDFDPIDFYSLNMRRLNLNKLLSDQTITQRLMLSTSDGKYTVRKLLRVWDPIHLVFRNHLTIVAHPMRSLFKGKAYGSNTAYLVDMKLADKSQQVVAIHPRDYEIRVFRNFRLTKDSLESKEALEALLNKERESGNLAVESLVVHDANATRERIFESSATERIEAKPVGVVMYYVVGWLMTRLSDWKLRRKNKANARKKQKQSQVDK